MPKKKEEIKKGDRVTYIINSKPTIKGMVLSVKGNTARVFWDNLTEPGKSGKIPIKRLMVIPR